MFLGYFEPSFGNKYAQNLSGYKNVELRKRCSTLGGRKLPTLVWKTNIQNRGHKNTPQIRIQNHTNLEDNLSFSFFKRYLNIVLASASKPSKWAFIFSLFQNMITGIGMKSSYEFPRDSVDPVK
jgi:hypothetical protein